MHTRVSVGQQSLCSFHSHWEVILYLLSFRVRPMRTGVGCRQEVSNIELVQSAGRANNSRKERNAREQMRKI